jgi:hypothetical protein
MVCSEPEGGSSEQDPAEQQLQQQDPNGDDMDDIGVQQEQQEQQEHQQQSIPETPTIGGSRLLESQSNDDIEMPPAQEEDSQAGLIFQGADSTDETHLGRGEHGQTAPVHPQSTASRTRLNLPPHRVLRSRFPTLAHLAGNVILNHMDAQTTKGGVEGAHRPRKDSKISMEEGDDWLEDPIEPCNSGDMTRYDVYDDRRKQTLASRQKEAGGQAVLFKEEVLKEYMTPYLFDIFKRARINNRCAGCQRRFWKPCRIVIVWQDVLGQRQVPVRWKGCGIGTCPGVPETLWPRQTISSSSLSSPDLAGQTSLVDGSPSSSSGATRTPMAS